MGGDTPKGFKSPDPQQIFQQPQQPSTFFQNNFTGICTDSGIIRWFGGFKSISDKQRKQCKQFMEAMAAAFPTLTSAQQSCGLARSAGFRQGCFERSTFAVVEHEETRQQYLTNRP